MAKKANTGPKCGFAYMALTDQSYYEGQKDSQMLYGRLEWKEVLWGNHTKNSGKGLPERVGGCLQLRCVIRKYFQFIRLFCLVYLWKCSPWITFRSWKKAVVIAGLLYSKIGWTLWFFLTSPFIHCGKKFSCSLFLTAKSYVTVLLNKSLFIKHFSE